MILIWKASCGALEILEGQKRAWWDSLDPSPTDAPVQSALSDLPRHSVHLNSKLLSRQLGCETSHYLNRSAEGKWLPDPFLLEMSLVLSPSVPQPKGRCPLWLGAPLHLSLLHLLKPMFLRWSFPLLPTELLPGATVLSHLNTLGMWGPAHSKFCSTAVPSLCIVSMEKDLQVLWDRDFFFYLV